MNRSSPNMWLGQSQDYERIEYSKGNSRFRTQGALSLPLNSHGSMEENYKHIMSGEKEERKVLRVNDGSLRREN